MSEQLFDKGTICALSISRWSGQAGLTRADFKTMGIDPDAMPKELSTMGRKFLVSPASLKGILEIEGRARQCLAKHSKPFMVTGCAFVPNSQISAVTEQLQEYQQQFNQAVDTFISNFQSCVDSVKEKYADFWEKCLRHLYPADANRLRSKFGFQFVFFKVDATTDEQKAALQTAISEFVADYAKTMRQEVVEFCDLVKARITETPGPKETEAKAFTGRTLSALRKYADAFNDMNIFGDNEIATLLQNFRRDFAGELNTVKDFESADVKASVLQAVAAIRSKATDDLTYVSDLKRRIVI